MYWHGSMDNTRRTVEKIIADRAKGILVITGIGSTPCPLEGLKSTLDSITLSEMSFGPEEELFIDAKGRPCGSQEEAGHGHISALVGRQDVGHRQVREGRVRGESHGSHRGPIRWSGWVGPTDMGFSKNGCR